MMAEFDLLAPGPSASLELAESLRGRRVGAVGNAYELAPFAEFMAASDRQWWQKHPEAMEFQGQRYSGHMMHRVIQLPASRTNWNSGVLALAVAAHLGATLIRLHGFDMHGTHFFGPYTNGLGNTPAHRREVHKKQYALWQRQNPNIQVINCTPGSELRCFPFDEQAAA